MKNSFLFKTLIDIFFFFQVIGLIALLTKIPLGFMPVKNMEPLHLNGWTFLIINCIIYLIFLRGLFFMRKIAREFIIGKTLTKTIANYMKITGNNFTSSGLILLIIMIIDRFFNLHIDPIPKSFSITPIFLVIVGLFFIIQSQTYLKAIKIKDENDLTV